MPQEQPQPGKPKLTPGPNKGIANPQRRNTLAEPSTQKFRENVHKNKEVPVCFFTVYSHSLLAIIVSSFGLEADLRRQEQLVLLWGSVVGDASSCAACSHLSSTGTP